MNLFNWGIADLTCASENGVDMLSRREAKSCSQYSITRKILQKIQNNDDNKQTNHSQQQLFSTKNNSKRCKGNVHGEVIAYLDFMKYKLGLSMSIFTFLSFFQQQLHEVLQCFGVSNSTKC